MNSAEEFSKTMFGDNFQSKVPIEKIQKNSSFIGVLKYIYINNITLNYQHFTSDLIMNILLFFSQSLVLSGLMRFTILKLRYFVKHRNI